MEAPKLLPDDEFTVSMHLAMQVDRTKQEGYVSLPAYNTMICRLYEVSTIYRSSSAGGYSHMMFYETIVWDWSEGKRGRCLYEGSEGHFEICNKLASGKLFAKETDNASA